MTAVVDRLIYVRFTSQCTAPRAANDLIEIDFRIHGLGVLLDELRMAVHQAAFSIK